MGTYDALLKSVLANPDDDLPRLVMADWLDENGREQRAADIRPFGGAMTAASGSSHRTGTHPPRERWWEGEPRSLSEECHGLLLDGFDSVHYRRGFVWAVECSLAVWLARGPAVVARHPVEVVTLTDAVHTREYGGGDDRPAVCRQQLGPIWPFLCVDPHPDNIVFAEYHDRDGLVGFVSVASIRWAKSAAGSNVGPG